MRMTVETPIDAALLPPEVRAGLPDGTLVKVSLEVLRDENGFTPERAKELEDAVEELSDPSNLIGPFDGVDALHAHLDRAGGKCGSSRRADTSRAMTA